MRLLLLSQFYPRVIGGEQRAAATRATFAPSKEAANRVTYQILRQTATGPVSIPSSGMTLLQSR
jgi:hypothetical protein